MNWFKIAGRARYQGQLQGDETNQNSTNERYQDNEAIEGEDGMELRECFFEGLKGNWTPFTMKVQNLLEQGYNQSRIDSMVASYTRGNIDKMKTKTI
ncbi:MAG: hypothetical protein J7L15_07275 [Clostridiales bacterium]|nr:hypothetical protein [Clostridiales bacterium]